MTLPQRLLPWIMFLFSLMLLGSMYSKPQSLVNGFNLEAFGQIPVSGEGRVKPIDTVARNKLMLLSGKRTFRIDGERQSATRWFIDVLARPQVAAGYEVFRVNHPGVVDLLGIEAGKRTRFSFAEIVEKQEEIRTQAALADEVEAKKRDPFQREVLTLYHKMSLLSRLAHYSEPYAAPPIEPGEAWRSLNEALSTNKESASVRSLWAALQAYSQDNPAAFNHAVDDHLRLMNEHLPRNARRGRYEVMLNNARPLSGATGLYVLAFLLGCIGLLMGQLSKPGWVRSVGAATLVVLSVSFLAHTLGIGARIYLQGRPPVTNLYSSAVFIGWVCVPLGIIVDRRLKFGLGGVVSAAIGFITLVIAQNLGEGGDTMEMMQAVLDSNFWLATHVVVITIGYSATFFAGVLGTGYLLLGVFTRMLDAEHARSLGKMIYGVVCFAALMSFVGTVLGGIWADQSWGRFWGWDPKENGAAMIVLMNLITMHARWGGLIRDRGVAALAVAGNIVTAWSWFGTNMLGVGLHSYGFTDSAVFWLSLFVLSQLVIIGIGMLPTSVWRSSLERSGKKVSAAPKSVNTAGADGSRGA